MCDDVAEMERKGTAPVTDRLAAFLSAHYAVAMKRAVREAAGGSVNLKTLRTMCEDVVALRRGDQDAEWLKLERKRLALDEEHSIVRFRKKMRIEMDELFAFIDRHNPLAREAFAAFREEMDKRQELWFEKQAEAKRRSRDKREPAAEPNPDKSGEIPSDPTKSDQIRSNPTKNN